MKTLALGYMIPLYERYIDDSNQGIVVEEDKDAVEVIMELKEIANSILPGLEVEVDMTFNYDDGKLPILDMKCYMKNDVVVYEHYSKPMATDLIISARSAHSEQTKRSVHISECVRRMMNTSPLLSWEEHTVPHLNEYSRRMMAAGYSQTYRKEILRHAVSIYEHKLEQDREGIQPLNRPRGYKRAERRTAKRVKKRTWATKGGFTAPIIVPATPNSELANQMRAVCDAEAIPGLKFKVIERGGRTIERQLQKSNPTASNTCGKPKCDPCNQPGGNGGNKLCHKNNVVYQYECLVDECDAAYRGETSRNLYSRNLEHQYLYTGGPNKLQNLQDKSFIFNHQKAKHNGEPSNFKVSVLKSYQDSLSRQSSEAVHISKIKGEILNSKSEFYQPSIVRVRREVSMGV